MTRLPAHGSLSPIACPGRLARGRVRAFGILAFGVRAERVDGQRRASPRDLRWLDRANAGLAVRQETTGESR